MCGQKTRLRRKHTHTHTHKCRYGLLAEDGTLGEGCGTAVDYFDSQTGLKMTDVHRRKLDQCRSVHKLTTCSHRGSFSSGRINIQFDVIKYRLFMSVFFFALKNTSKYLFYRVKAPCQ